MKLLENSNLEAISSTLSIETPVCNITTRMESYSCKMAGDPKKLYKQLRNEPGTSPHDLEILGPSQTKPLAAYGWSVLNSPPQVLHGHPIARSISSDDESPLFKTIPRKTLIFLISTLNASFEPDYEFSSCTSHDFSRETNLELVKNNIDSRLLSTMGDHYRPLSSQLWSVIDEEINIKESEIFSYRPDDSSDPFSESGIIWSVNFFFYNRKLRRIVFLVCRADSKTSTIDTNNDEDEPLEYNHHLTFEGIMD